jgi:hypothetical protein
VRARRGLALAIALACAARAGAAGFAPEQLYPYVVPAAYLEQGGKDLARPIGHGLHVALVFDLGETVQSARAEDLRQLGVSIDGAHRLALDNLERLADERKLRMAMFSDGPGGRPFVLIRGHWATATAILLPNLLGTVSKPLATQDVCVSIPHREAFLAFPCADRAYRDAMRAFVREREAGGPKPLTWGLFRIGESGVSPLTE